MQARCRLKQQIQSNVASASRHNVHKPANVLQKYVANVSYAESIDPGVPYLH